MSPEPHVRLRSSMSSEDEPFLAPLLSVPRTVTSFCSQPGFADTQIHGVVLFPSDPSSPASRLTASHIYATRVYPVQVWHSPSQVLDVAHSFCCRVRLGHAPLSFARCPLPPLCFHSSAQLLRPELRVGLQLGLELGMGLRRVVGLWGAGRGVEGRRLEGWDGGGLNGWRPGSSCTRVH